METFYKVDTVSIRNGFPETYVFFRVPTDIGDKFMRISKAEKDGYVVVVDAQKFLSFWRNTTNPTQIEFANGNPAIWKKDRKIHLAKNGFDYGEIDPVPLATVACFSPEGEKPYVNIEGGITRTMFLLAANAKSFPVECDGNNAFKTANLLNELAGIPNGEVKSVNELILANK